MRSIILLACLFFCGLSEAAKAELIVIEVSGTEAFSPGDKIDTSSAIVLPENARLTILSKSGEMQVLVGPHSAKVEQSTSGEVAAFDQWDAVTSIFGQSDKRTETFGASRNLDGDIPPTPGVWDVSIDSSGPRCSTSGSLVFWRRNSDKTERVSVRTADTKLNDVVWEKGLEGLDVTSLIAPANGRMIVGIGAQLRELELHVFPGPVKTIKQGVLLGWLLEKGCNRQARALIDLVHNGLKNE